MASDVICPRDHAAVVCCAARELLHDQLDRFESLLADLLEISRFDAGAAQLETESTDLRVVVGAAVEAARPLARARGCEIVELFPDQPCVAACDPATHRTDRAQSVVQCHRAR